MPNSDKFPGVNASDMIHHFVERFGMTESQARIVVHTLRDTLAHGIANQVPVEIRGFGAISYGMQQARKARNPKTGASVELESKVTLRFRPLGDSVKVLDEYPT